MALPRLVVLPTNPHAREVTPEQRPNRAVGDDGKVATIVRVHDRRNRPDNTGLCILCGFPAAKLKSGAAKNAFAAASNRDGGKKPVALRSFSPSTGFNFTSRPCGLASMATVCSALRSVLDQMALTEAMIGAIANTSARARPTSLSPQSVIAISGFTSTSGCEMTTSFANINLPAAKPAPGLQRPF